MDKLPMDSYYAKGLELTKHVGKLIREQSKKPKNIQYKSGPTDMVTETDKLVEDYVFTSLRKSFPDHKYIGEESAAEGHPVEFTDAPTWIIDPVDGTMNFVHGYPSFCVSLALWVNKEPCIGYVYNPILEQLFTAQKGKGAFLNGQRISCSKETELSRSLVILELGSVRDPKKMENMLVNVRKLLPKVHAVRMPGSAALDMAQVAAGGSECYFDYGIHVWDIAAGTMLVREAGGVVLDPTGDRLDPLSRKVLCAGTMEIAKQVMPLLEHYQSPRD